MTQWDLLLKYINLTKIGKTISRKEFLKTTHQDQRGIIFDSYFRYLLLLGIITWAGRKIYRVKHHLKDDTTIEQIKDLAFPPLRKHWKDWFIPKKEAIKKFIKK